LHDADYVLPGQHPADEPAATLAGALFYLVEVHMKNRLTIRCAFVLAVAFVILNASLAPSALAQGCAMCYQNASATGAQGSQALRHGILILLFPTLTVFTGIFGLIYRRRNVAR
jgi:hypothetical protein